MTRDNRDRIEHLDRQWDRYLDGERSGSDGDVELDRIARLHRRDDTPAPSADLRARLQDDLLNTHSGRSAQQATTDTGDGDRVEGEPELRPAGRKRGGPVTINRPRSLRDWGELAAMLVILVLAILGASLYGEDAYDYAQRQLADQNQSPDVTEQRQSLEDEGEVDGLSFEEAQALTPFEMASPGSLPEGLSDGEYRVSMTPTERGATSHQWEIWQSEAAFPAEGEALDPVTVTARPGWEQAIYSVPREAAGQNIDTPVGHLDVLELNGTGVVRTVEFSEEGEVHTTYLWKQGDVELTVRAPLGVDLNDEQRAWIETPATPFGGDDIERMIASIIEQGPLAVDTDDIPQRGLAMAHAREWLPTAPLPDIVPEQLELSDGELWTSLHGPAMQFKHASDETIGDISLRAFSGYYHPERREQLHDAGGETFDHNGVEVGRTVLVNPFDTRTSDFLVDATLSPGLLLPWLEQESDHSLVTYIWDIAGMGFMMGVEVPRDYVETAEDGTAVLSSEASESDWLAVIDAQRRTAEEHLRPEQHFSVLNRDPGPEDETPGDPHWPGSQRERTQSRLLGETETYRYYLQLNDGREVCIREVHVDEEQSGGGGCSPLWSAAETGVMFRSGGTDKPTTWATILPDGYEEVVDENNELIAEVESNLFAIELESGESRPAEMTARGPAGELTLTTP